MEQKETMTYLAKRLPVNPLAEKWTRSKHSEAGTQQQSMTEMPRLWFKTKGGACQRRPNVPRD